MSKEELIQNIKDCGHSLIDNAENIANNYKFMSRLTITCYVDQSENAPYISIDTDFVPEKFVERVSKENLWTN